MGGNEISPWDLGAHPEVHTEEEEGRGQEGIKRWGIEGNPYRNL